MFFTTRTSSTLTVSLLLVLAGIPALAWQPGMQQTAYRFSHPYQQSHYSGYRNTLYQYAPGHQQAVRSRPVTPILRTAVNPAQTALDQVSSKPQEPVTGDRQPSPQRQTISEHNNAVKAPAERSLPAAVKESIQHELATLQTYSLNDLDAVPRIEIDALSDWYLEIKDSTTRKELFFKTLLPLILLENEQLLTLRKELSTVIDRLEQGEQLGATEQAWLRKLAQRYRVKGDVLKDTLVRTTLLQHVDIIPASLTLSQAANESAWGRSRFAQEANNLFGIWTYDETKGIVPKNRDPGQKHLIRKFSNYRESIRYYMHTLNSHPAYKKLRDIRAQQRKTGQAPTGTALADGLEKYSGMGHQYITSIKRIIENNRLERLETAVLARG